jgi:MoaA/NifB/PqqE/SkfB family radical SAM enzyme
MGVLTTNVSLLGLPLDGPDRRTHGLMRGSERHFDVVVSLIQKLAHCGVRTKINTVVSRVNVTCLERLESLIEALSPVRWSVYQYWPLAGGAVVRPENEISEAAFLRAVAHIPRKLGKCVVEVNPVSSRCGTYFFVSQNGIAYAHKPDDPNRYQVIGDMFEDRTIEAWRHHAERSVRAPAAERYASLRDVDAA